MRTIGDYLKNKLRRKRQEISEAELRKLENYIIRQKIKEKCKDDFFRNWD